MARVAFLLDTQFEDSEMKSPYEEIKTEGHEVVIVGNESGTLCHGKNNEVSYRTEISSKEALSEHFDAVIIPGGLAPEALRVNENTIKFVKLLNEQSKIIAGICHGPQVMISADIVKGKTLTCFKGIRDDVINAGAIYVDNEVVYSENIITSRTPKDEAVFIKQILNAIG
ncbi:type 1 glutamine amidotransferase domain-containing protein [Virgibacillus halodenitrificans]|uniref:type 1 glutamine amidotransferase domain-containing protein n=1 Tax=Virgibacillus halodenitrificans TaxID=1482 RepID=UPI002DBBC298|nr:type 1 glutamine amidotransferase domain-containing protein [Virgibacillus halodenitrificans]MEC2159569.1 type 1 glutamine amidotransferase [Virgibacillus halodenitrificans]